MTASYEANNGKAYCAKLLDTTRRMNFQGELWCCHVYHNWKKILVLEWLSEIILVSQSQPFNHFISLPPIVVEAKTMVARPVNLVRETSIKKATFKGESKTWKLWTKMQDASQTLEKSDDAKHGAQELEWFRIIHTWHQVNVITYALQGGPRTRKDF